MYRVKIITSFSAAHYLRNYKGKCENLHGHNWKVEVSVVSASLNSSGMVMDFSDLKRLTKEVLSDFDHKHLNEIEFFKTNNPSSEEIAAYLFKQLTGRLDPNCKVDEIMVWETDSSCAAYRE